jgi:hypothetical protein
MGSPLIGNEQTGDLTLHLRRHDDGPWLCQCLHPRRNVRRVTENLTCRIDHYRAGFDTDARVERWLARTCILAVDLSERALDGKGRPCGAFGRLRPPHVVEPFFGQLKNSVMDFYGQWRTGGVLGSNVARI